MKSTPRSLATDRAVFAPYASILDRLPRDRLPSVEEIDAACSPGAGVRFERAAPRPRRGPKPVTAYDERIALGVVPTRSGSVHDLMNAVVWSAFPRAKRRVHARQLALLRASADPSKRSLEHDTLAMLDEGGVLFTGEPDAPDSLVVFGHAILEHAATADAPVFGLGVRVESAPARELHDLDRALAGMLDEPGRFVSHRSFPRVRVSGTP